MAKQLLFGEEGRQKILKGAEILARAVVTTLGPRGRNVALERKWGSPSVVHDGVTVAKEIELLEPFENMGAQLVKEAASKTNDVAGDGTTTATLLAWSMISNGLKNVTAGANPMLIKKGIEKATLKAVEELKRIAKPVKGEEEIAQVATISAADSQIGRKIAEALQKVGRDGVITVEEGRGLELEIAYKEGMEFDQGFASPYFVTNPETMEAVIEKPYILITDKKISSVQEILPFLENIVKVTKNFVIIAEEIEAEALATLVVNKLRGTFNCIAIKAPGFGDRRKELLEDIAVLTGGTVISEDTGRKLESVEPIDCGQADRVVTDKDGTQIIGGLGNKGAIKARIAQIKSAIDKSDSDYDAEKLQERLAKLAGGVAVINVGAATEVELKEKQERVKDAVEATKAALEEGILPGGGVSFLKAKKVLDQVETSNEEEKIGVEIVRQALEQPTRWLAKNSGKDDGYVLNIIEEKMVKMPDFGYNALTDKFESMIKAGVLDPLKVSRSALQNAASVAAMVLTTEVLISDIPEKEEDKTPGMPGGMGGGMGGM
ncbi:chaperonin GroEL [Candidatus Shapirobacteria bacterium]|nr:chaperonin GroEL [Candidatus Shapirobacteria bacterium]